MNQSGSQH